MSARHILIFFILCSFLVAVASVLFYFRHAQDLVVDNSQRNLEKTSSALTGEFQSYITERRYAVNFVSQRPEVVNGILERNESTFKQMTTLMNSACDTYLASACYVLDDTGTTLASDTSRAESIIGNKYDFRPYFKNAMSQGEGLYLAIGYTTRKRGLYFSNAVFDEEGKTIGVMIMKFSPKVLEDVLDRYNEKAALVDNNGFVFVSTNPDWTLKSLWELTEEQQTKLSESRQFGANQIDSIGLRVIDSDYLEDATGTRYLLNTKTIKDLPGWSIVLFRQPDKLPIAEALNSQTSYAFGVFFFVICVISMLLYRKGVADISRTNAERSALKAKELRLRQIVQISNEAILVQQGDQIIEANQTAEQLFGISQDELTQRTVWHLLDAESYKIAKTKESEGYEDPYEVNALRQDGTTFPAELSHKAIEIEDRLLKVTYVRDISEQKSQEEHILYQAHFDSLSGLPNRSLMLDRLRQSIKKSHRSNLHTVVMFIDLDDFKKVNDVLGHSIGDQLIIEAGKRISEEIREEDTLARLGGDEFVLIMEDIENLTDVESIALKVMAALAKEFIINRQSLFISGSIGIAVSPEDGDTTEDLLKKADTAMYCSKDEGGNTFHFYTESMNDRVKKRIEIEHHLRNALDNNEFFIHYQPVYSIETGKLISAEALLRWRNENLGLIGPDQFIPVAEQSGLINEIGEWVLQSVCTQVRRWLDLGIDDFYVSVNISPRQFRDKRLLPMVGQTLSASQIPPSSICFEITEGLLIKNNQDTEEAINNLKKMGIQLSLDDFGTGYSSLSYLKRYPFDHLKIDRSFVRDIDHDANDRQVVQATVAMSQGLGLNVIAEGVETDAQYEFLKSIGCQAVQGYLLSKPIDVESFTRVILQSRKNSSDNTSRITSPEDTESHHHKAS